MHYYKFFIGDYQKKTSGLSLAEHGAYRILLDEYYAKEFPLSTDKSRLYRIAGASSKTDKSAVDHILETYFTLTEEGYVHSKCDEVIEAANAIAMANSIKGKSGGRGHKRVENEKPIESQNKATALPDESCGKAESKPDESRTKAEKKPPHYLTTSLPQENTNTHPNPPNGGDVVAELEKLIPPGEMDAKLFHAEFANSMRRAGWSVETEYFIADRGDGRSGRIDIAAFKDGASVGVELDRERPRLKSIQKLKTCGMIGVCVQRDPAVGVPRVVRVNEADRFVLRQNPKSYRTPEFERWYAVYPKHVGPEAAARALKKTLDLIQSRHESREAALQWLMDVTANFSTSQTALGSFCWHPATFLNGGHYDDDPIAWERSGAISDAMYSGIDEARRRREFEQQEALP